jgi:hypothetical protein
VRFISVVIAPHAHVQGLENAIPEAFALPAAEGVVSGVAQRQIVGDQSLGTAATQHVQDGVHELASLVRVGDGVWAHRRDQRFPLCIREIGGIGVTLVRVLHRYRSPFRGLQRYLCSQYTLPLQILLLFLHSLPFLSD